MPKKRFEKGGVPGQYGPHKRNINAVSKRYRYLIVCEGEKTEPHYFEALKRQLPNAVAEVVTIDIDGAGMNTRSLVEFALEKFKAKSVIRILGVSWNRPIERLHLSYIGPFFLPGVSFLSHAERREASRRRFDTPR
jgi:hypothetical protein